MLQEFSDDALMQFYLKLSPITLKFAANLKERLASSTQWLSVLPADDKPKSLSAMANKEAVHEIPWTAFGELLGLA